MQQEIRIQNTMSGRKEALTPLQNGKIGMYACGVTTYDESHIGHAMQAIFFDVVRNYLEYAGYDVTYVRNYTDVDDKIIMRAATLGITPRELAEQIIDSTAQDLEGLGVKRATHEPKVSETIPEIIAMIEALIREEAAYPTPEGDVYYRVRGKKDYGKLSKQKPEDLRAGTREIVAGQKEDPLDFALWKADTTPTASWDSPWGAGRPGWHIECSAMAKKFLGNSFDIHGGGRDLVFPHHENEIAQSESANCAAYASIWMHSGLLTIEKQKMSKSLGNSITIKSFLAKWPAEVLRLGYLQNHYGSHIDFNEDVFRTCRMRLIYYYETLQALRGLLDDTSAGVAPEHTAAAKNAPVSGQEKEFFEGFHKAMRDDFNTVSALAVVNKLMKVCNQLLRQKRSPSTVNNAAGFNALLTAWGDVLGLFKEEPLAYLSTLKEQALPDLGLTKDEIEAQIERRLRARQNKDWAQGDQIRDELLRRGITLRDTPNETTWTLSHSYENEAT